MSVVGTTSTSPIRITRRAAYSAVISPTEFQRRWKTGSLYPCIALHSLNNALALGITQFHWNAEEIVALMAGSLGLIGLLTLPLAGRSAAA